MSCRETFNEDEVDGMLLSGLEQKPSVTVEPAVVVDKVLHATSHEQASGDTNDDDFVMISSLDSTKRNLEGGEQDNLPKRVKI